MKLRTLTNLKQMKKENELISFTETFTVIELNGTAGKRTCSSEKSRIFRGILESECPQWSKDVYGTSNTTH